MFRFRAKVCNCFFAAALVALGAGVNPVSLPAGQAERQAAAQNPSKPAPMPLARTVVLPPRLLAGHCATLAVLDAAGRLVPEIVVELSGGERITTDATGRATFVAPAEAGVLSARLVGREGRFAATVVAPPPIMPDGVQVFDYPQVVAVSDRFAIEGSGFRGEADANHTLLGDQPAFVLAASPISLALLPGPHAAIGPTQLLIEVGGRSPGPVPLTLVSFELKATNLRLAEGEKGVLTVRARGTEQRVVIEARNLTPQVVELPRGNTHRLTTSGGPVNSAEIELQGVRLGDFSVSVRLVPGAVGLPDMEAVRRRLLAARQLAPGAWPERVDRVIGQIERDPQDVARVRAELEKLLAKNPEGEFGRLLEAARRELQKR